MSSDIEFTGNESEDSDTVEVFLNQFSDTDEGEESVDRQAIFTVKNTHVLKESFRPNCISTVNRPSCTSLKRNADRKADDKFVPSYSRVDYCNNRLLGYTSSESSDLDDTDDSTSSDDMYTENWPPFPKQSKNRRNKNVIPIGRDPPIASNRKDALLSDLVKDIPTETKYSTRTYNQTSPTLSRNRDTDGTQLSKIGESSHLEAFHVDINRLSTAKSGFVRDGDIPPAQPRSSNSDSKMNDADEIGGLHPNFSDASHRATRMINPKRAKSPNNMDAEKLSSHLDTGPPFGTNVSGIHQFEVQSNSSGNSVLSSWNENWTTDDYLICPNFLLGASDEEGVAQVAGHTSDRIATPSYRSDRIPRMFHRRINKDEKRDASRDDRFSDVASSMNTPLNELFKIVKEMGIDLVKFLEQADKLGLPLKFPCLQCHEGSTMSEIANEFISGSAYPPDGRCKRCGGQLQTFASLAKMVTKLRDTVAKNNFEIRDVYPDGNCMFGTVIDQLRVRGDFRYTIHTLRAAVVDYLRRNPKAEDGTPLEMFLTNETWGEYLKRMSEDGQWGDHMTLNALTNVLQMRILIFGGRSGETETVLTPNTQEKERTNDTASDVEGTYIATTASDVEGTDIASTASDVEGTDIATTASDVEGTDIDTVYMCHLGETHYVSFRPENWRQDVQEKNYQTLLEWEHQKFEPLKSLYVPVQHLDFILRHTIKLKHISNYLPTLADIPNDDQGSEFAVTFVGPIMCKLVPDYTSQIESMAPDISIFFPDTIYKAPSSSCVLSVFQTPCDSFIQRSMSGRKRLNLLTEKSSSDMSQVRLLPVTASLWEGQTIKSSTGTVYLRVIELDLIPFETFLQSVASKDFTMHRTLAFKSEWPEVADEWISRDRKSGKPENFVIQSVASNGCHVVPITTNENQINVIDSFITTEMIESRDLWSYSFAVAETKISSHISYSQRCCFLLLKSLLDFTCDSPAVPDSLPKSVFFYACENIEEESWCLMPGRCLIVMLEKLVIGLRMNFVPHYFISAQNLLQNIPPDHIEIWAKHIEGILKQPVIYLYYVLDLLDITSSEIGTVFDETIEDLPKFNSHKSLERSFSESLIPSSGMMIENLIYQKQYDFAMTSLEDLHEEICRFTKGPISVAKVMNMVMPSIAIGYKWCLGLYIDLIRGTSVTREVGSSLDAVHITEVFGPDIDDEVLSNTVVPAIYSIPSGDLKFPSVCAEVMLEAGRKSLLAKCLRYYIDTYSEIAGDNIVIGDHAYVQYHLKSLQGIYMTLLAAYNDLGRVSKFRKLMDNFTMIIQLRQVHSGFHDLAKAWELLGEPEKAIQACPCYLNDKGGDLQGMIKDIAASMGRFDY